MPRLTRAQMHADIDRIRDGDLPKSGVAVVGWILAADGHWHMIAMQQFEWLEALAAVGIQPVRMEEDHAKMDISYHVASGSGATDWRITDA